MPGRFQTIRKHELLILGALLVTWLSANLMTADRSPTIWGDEVQCSDAALSWLQGRGFRSGAFAYQSDDRTLPWVSPVHAAGVVVLAGLFGVNPTAVRATNYVFLVATILLVISAVRRLRILERAETRITLAVLLLLGYGITYSYRSGRYDMAGLLSLSIGFFGFALTSPKATPPAENPPSFLRTGYGLLGASGLLTALSGMQLLPFACLLIVFLWGIVGGRIKTPALIWILGLGAGLGGLVAVFNALGIWRDFIFALSSFSPKEGFFRRFLTALRPSDYSSCTIVILLAGFVLKGLKARTLRWRAAETLGVGVYFGILAGMSAAGRFPLYYTWMIYVPLTIVFANFLESRSFLEASRPTKIFVIASTVLAAGLGLPARLGVTLLQWRQRDYRTIERFVEHNIQPGDRIYSTWAAFYPLRRDRHIHADFGDYIERLTDDERSRLNVAILTEDDDGQSKLSMLGPGWAPVEKMPEPAKAHIKVPGPVSQRGYPGLVVYRRSVLRTPN